MSVLKLYHTKPTVTAAAETTADGSQNQRHIWSWLEPTLMRMRSFQRKFLKTKQNTPTRRRLGKQNTKLFFPSNPKKKEKMDQTWYCKHPEKIQINLKGFPWQNCNRIWIRDWGFIRKRGIREFFWVLALLGISCLNKMEKNATRPLHYAPLSFLKIFRIISPLQKPELGAQDILNLH